MSRARPGTAQWRELPASLRASIIAERQKAASAEHALKPEAGVLVARNRHFATRFERGRVLVGDGTPTGTSPLDLHATHAGCDGAVTSLDEVEATRVDETQNRVEYRRPGLTEWYVNGSLGLEQGFTVERSACGGASPKELVIRLDAAAAAEPRTGDDGARVTFGARPGIVLDELYARDASGAELAARFVGDGPELAMRVDVSDARWPVEVDPLAWRQMQVLVASDGAPGDQFGFSVSLSGDTALVGAHRKNSATGAAYVFARAGTALGLNATLQASDGAVGDFFGASLSLSGDAALVGASGKNSSAGTAYVFGRAGTGWTQQAILLASSRNGGDRFGASVSLNGDTALVGAYGTSSSTGAAFVFTRTGSRWSQQTTLVASDGTTNDWFGYSVSLGDGTALVGARGADAAYVFSRTGTAWTEQAKLVANDSLTLGDSVSLAGDTALVGDVYQNDITGAAYVFVRAGTTWTQQAKLLANDGATFNYFGNSVSLRGDTALVGVPRDDEKGSDFGAVYVFTRTGSTWSQQTKFAASDGTNNDQFGFSVSLSGTTALVGVPSKNSITGAAYVFEGPHPNGGTCATSNDCVSGYCVEGICCDSACTNFCQSCMASRKATGADGVCGNVSANTDPRDGCADDGPPTCDRNGFCDGGGACQLYSAGTACLAQSCATATSINVADSCDGAGTCIDHGTLDCSPGYACVSNACATTCTDSAACASGYTCVGGACRKPLASPCGADSECHSNVCADGFCCDRVCSLCEACSVAQGATENGTCKVHAANADPQNDCDLCEACDGAGACRPAAAGTDPKEECPRGSTCYVDGQCDGAGVCRVYTPQGVGCGSNTCVSADGTSSQTGRACDGEGGCTDSPAVSCGLYKCGETTCRTTCASDSDCQGTAFCTSAGLCATKQASGAACIEARECTSGNCADGVCCSGPCGGQCQACNESGSIGTCTPVTGAPRGGRAPCAGGAGECGGSCDGQSEMACTYPGSAISCGTPVCEEDSVRVHQCDGAGVCVDGALNACGSSRCAGGACITSCDATANCADGYTCQAGACKKPLGATCSAPGECHTGLCQTDRCVNAGGVECTSAADCSSGFCADGVCCNDDCVGQCEACDEPESLGTCTPVSGAPRGGREPCAGDPEVCGGQCSGRLRDQCEYASSTQTCGSSCEAGSETSSRCDGSGACVPGQPRACSPYICGEDACLSVCSADGDCDDGYRCGADGKCVPTGGAKCTDEVTSQGPDGLTDCSPYVCDTASGNCRDTCRSSADCAADNVCNSNSKACEPAEEEAGGKDDGGCGCRTAPTRHRLPSGLLALAAAAMLAWSQRRRLRRRQYASL